MSFGLYYILRVIVWLDWFFVKIEVELLKNFMIVEKKLVFIKMIIKFVSVGVDVFKRRVGGVNSRFYVWGE